MNIASALHLLCVKSINEAFVYIIVSSVYINEAFVYVNEVSVYIICLSDCVFLMSFIPSSLLEAVIMICCANNIFK